MDKSNSSDSSNEKIGLIALVAIVVSSMIGSGIDSLPQNMAESSAVGPVIIAWLICGFGMYFIAKVFIVLSGLRPDLQAGIYMYAREGFGPLAAFVVAWGYWLMTIFSNVAFSVMIMDTLNYFLPGHFKGGNNLASIIGASILIWGFHVLVLRGTRLAGRLNVMGTVAKLVPLVVFVATVVYFLNYSILSHDIWGDQPSESNKPLGSVFSQVLTPLFVALWAFIGIESAVALSGRAKNSKDVSKATLIGFVISLTICLLVSVLPFGVMSQSTLGQLANPSTAGVMKSLTGDWGEWLINVGVLISILSSWLAWTMICAEIPMVAAQNGTFPAAFAIKNDKGAASTSLWVSSAIMQAVLLLVYFANNAWLALLAISAVMVLPAYFTSAAYLIKVCLTGEYARRASDGRIMAIVSGVIGVIFCLFMVYASEIKYVAMTPLIITLGIPLNIWAKLQNQKSKNIFNQCEYAALLLLLVIDALVLYLFSKGTIAL